MLAYFDKDGRIIKLFEYGRTAHIGSTDYNFFAYFEGVETDIFSLATLNLKKPSGAFVSAPLQAGAITKHLVFDEDIDTDSYAPFVNDSYPRGFSFQIGSYNNTDGSTTIYLDEAGLWEATITLTSEDGRMVEGKATFYVFESALEIEDMGGDGNPFNTMISLIASRLAANSNFYFRVIESEDEFNTKSAVFSVDSYVYVTSTKAIHKVTGINEDGTIEHQELVTFLKKINTGVDGEVVTGFLAALRAEIPTLYVNSLLNASDLTLTTSFTYKSKDIDTYIKDLVSETATHEWFKSEIEAYLDELSESAEKIENKVSHFSANPDDVHYPTEKLVYDQLTLIREAYELKSNKVTTFSNTPNHVHYPSEKLVYDSLQNVREVAEGKCKTFILSYDDTIAKLKDIASGYVNIYEIGADGKRTWITGAISMGDYDNKTTANSQFSSQDGSITISSAAKDYIIFREAVGAPVAIGSSLVNYVLMKVNDLSSLMKAGDIILVTELDVPDRWYGNGSTFYKSETSKIDVDGIMNAIAAKQDKNVVINAVDHLTLADSYSTVVPVLSAGQVVTAYNAIVAEKNVFIHDSLDKVDVSVSGRAELGGNVSISCTYLDRLILAYTVTDDGVRISYREPQVPQTFMTQSEFAALAEKDDDVTYFVYED